MLRRRLVSLFLVLFPVLFSTLSWATESYYFQCVFERTSDAPTLSRDFNLRMPLEDESQSYTFSNRATKMSLTLKGSGSVSMKIFESSDQSSFVFDSPVTLAVGKDFVVEGTGKSTSGSAVHYKVSCH